MKDITPRELEIIQYISSGFTNLEISKLLSISPLTVSTHRKNILRKFNLRNTALLIRYAFEKGLLK